MRQLIIMAYEFRFPDVGEGIAEGEIVKWRVKEGEQIKQDQVLLEIETDKAVVEIPSPRSGTIAKLHHKEGDTVKVGEVLVTISEVGEKITGSEAQTNTVKTEKRAEPVPDNRYSSSVVGQLEEAPPDKIMTVKEIEKRTEPGSVSIPVLATPAVRRLARDLQVNISEVAGTGIGGRVTEEDVRKSAASKGIAEMQPSVRVSKKYDFFGYVEHVPLKGVRKAAAEHVAKSAYTAVHVTHMDEVDVTELFSLREKEKAAAEKKGIHLTYLPFIVKALIAALKEHPMLNASLDDEHHEIIVKKYYNIGIAADTPDGLIVPVVKNADGKPILDIAKEIEDLAQRAQSRKLDLMDMKGSSFTITNIGVIGGLHATPVINWPDVAILATGRIYDKVVYRDEKIVVRKHMPFSIAFDHRVIDGAEVARFANVLKQNLEDPDMLMMKE